MFTALLYDTKRTYTENFENPPVYHPKVRLKGNPRVQIFGHNVHAPVGIAAGPLLNAEFIKAAVDMGANVVTYKTVRTGYRECLPYPNCVYIKPGSEITPDGAAFAQDEKTDTITNSFGMPSSGPDVWMPDVERAQRYVDENTGRVMIVSVVGTPDDQADDQIGHLANDYARCAALAKDAGARAIELNLSCPNVRKDLGAIYTDKDLTARIVSATRKEIGKQIPLFIKVGFWEKSKVMREVTAAAVKSGVTGIVGINTISMKVSYPDGTLPLPGRETSGVCGKGIEWHAVKWLNSITDLRREVGYDLVIGASGGIMEGYEFEDRLYRGADFALATTGAMLNPNIFVKSELFKGKIK